METHVQDPPTPPAMCLSMGLVLICTLYSTQYVRSSPVPIISNEYQAKISGFNRGEWRFKIIQKIQKIYTLNNTVNSSNGITLSSLCDH